MPIPIVIATIMRPEGDTGVQTHFQTYRAWLAHAGRDVSLVTPYNAPSWQVYPVFALRKLIDPLSGGGSVRWYRHWHGFFLERSLREQLSDGDACVIYAQCPVSASAALRARSDSQQRVVLVVHFNVSQADEWAGKGLISSHGRTAVSIRDYEESVLQQVDGLVFVSDFMRRTVEARCDFAGAVPNRVVPNFVGDPESVPVDALDGDLLIVGTLEPRKNQHYALEILAAAHSAGLPLTLSIAGDGPDRQMLEAAAIRLGVGSSVRFLGKVNNAAKLFSRHRACLHVARVENLPVTLIEAMSRGVPVFAPAVGGVPEVFDDGVEGHAIPLDDPLRCATLIATLLSDAESLKKAGDAARIRFLKDFQSDVAAARLTAFIDSI